MAKKIEEKNPVGRPKLADDELIKDSWCRVGASLAIALVLVICGIGVLTTRTPFEVLTFSNPNKIKGNVAAEKTNADSYDPLSVSTSKGTIRVIPAKKVSKRIIDAKGNVTKIIPAKSSR